MTGDGDCESCDGQVGPGSVFDRETETWRCADCVAGAAAAEERHLELEADGHAGAAARAARIVGLNLDIEGGRLALAPPLQLARLPVPDLLRPLASVADYLRSYFGELEAWLVAAAAAHGIETADDLVHRCSVTHYPPVTTWDADGGGVMMFGAELKIDGDRVDPPFRFVYLWQPMES